MKWFDYLDNQQEREQDADSRETSIEVMQAIVEVSTSIEDVNTIWQWGWARGVSHYSIIRRAKALADGTEQDCLNWGIEQIIISS